MQVSAGEWLETCKAFCKEAKHLAEHASWDERPNHSGWFRATATLLNADFQTVPGLYFQGEYRALRFGEEATSYALMYRSGRDVFRVFMIEVYPRHKITHRDGPITFYGPHLQLGDERLAREARQIFGNLALNNHAAWIDRFRRHARVYDNDPFSLISVAGKLFAVRPHGHS